MNVVFFLMYVNVAHLRVGVCVKTFCSPRFGWRGFFWLHREGIVVQDTVDGVFFLLAFIC
jgi:hypothetical protein